MKVLRLNMVIEISGLGKSTIYKYIAEGMFPKPIHLGPRCVGWIEDEIHAWIDARLKERAI